jgi:hypothetical protein
LNNSSNAKEKEGKGGIEKGVCPRCGRQYQYIEKRQVGKNVYYYAVHDWVKREDGKRYAVRCYLGSKKYSYVEGFQQLGLAGLIDEERFLRYALNVLDKLNEEQIRKLDGKLMLNFVLNITSKLDRESLRVIWQTCAKRLKELKTKEAKQIQQ